MKAAVHAGGFIKYETVDDPIITDTRDAIIKK